MGEEEVCFVVLRRSVEGYTPAGKERGSTDGGGDEGVLRHVGGGCDEGGKW
jgi:hypothetical protein